ncbi:MAG: hypothetical protein ACOX4K_05390 [Bacillota bacterium]
MKREIPTAITFIVGIIIIAAYYFKVPLLTAASNSLQNWGVIVSAFALGLAAVNLMRVHLTKIQRKQKGWIFSIMLLASMIITIFLGLTTGVNSPSYKLFFVTPRTALGATIYSLLGFYIASASYRAFIAKNVDATILLASAFLVLFGQTPYGKLTWRGFPKVVAWLLNVPNMAAQRGIIIGAAIGAIALSLRIMLGLEKTYSGLGQ